jgi:hypothetical protein
MEVLEERIPLLYEGDVPDSQMAEGFNIKKTSIFRERW